MKVTIDSSEPLTDVLRVVDSLYDVTLTTAGTGSETAASAPAGRRQSRRGGAAGQATPSTRGRSRRAPAAGSRVDPKAVRQWAWENGHDVNTRGSLPASVRDAYAAANPS